MSPNPILPNKKHFHYSSILTMSFKNYGLREMRSPSSICDQRETLEIKKTQSPAPLGVCRAAAELHLKQLKHPLYSLKMQEAHKHLKLPPRHQFIHPDSTHGPSMLVSSPISRQENYYILHFFSNQYLGKQEPCAKYNLRTVP